MRTLPSSKDQSAEPKKIADKINCSGDDIMDQWLHDTIHVDDDSSEEAEYLEGFPLPLPTEPNTPHFPVNLEASFSSLSIKKFPAAPDSVTDISDANDYSFASEYAQESADLAEILLDLTMTSAEQHDYRGLTTRQQSLLATGLSMMQKAEDAVREAIKACQAAGWQGFDTDYYCSPSIRDQGVAQPIKLNPHSPCSPSPKVSQSPPLLFLGASDEEEPEPEPILRPEQHQRLGTFENQKKTKRIESHRVR